MRPMANAPVLASVGIFIGLLLIFNSAAGWIFGYTIKSFPTPVRGDGRPLLGGYVSPHELGSTAVTLRRAARWSRLFFRFTTLGLAMRAAALQPGLEPARRHPRRLDAGARLGAGRRDRRGRRA